jgi:hypothetical protein
MVVILVEDVSQLLITYDTEYNIKPDELAKCGWDASDMGPSKAAEISTMVTVAMMAVRMAGWLRRLGGGEGLTITVAGTTRRRTGA